MFFSILSLNNRVESYTCDQTPCETHDLTAFSSGAFIPLTSSPTFYNVTYFLGNSLYAYDNQIFHNYIPNYGLFSPTGLRVSFTLNGITSQKADYVYITDVFDDFRSFYFSSEIGQPLILTGPLNLTDTGFIVPGYPGMELKINGSISAGEILGYNRALVKIPSQINSDVLIFNNTILTENDALTIIPISSHDPEIRFQTYFDFNEVGHYPIRRNELKSKIFGNATICVLIWCVLVGLYSVFFVNLIDVWKVQKYKYIHLHDRLT